MKNHLSLLTIPFMAACAGGHDKMPEKPNVVIMFVDDLGYYDLGFRNSDYYTPNIDKLAGESVIFESAYVPSPCCSPSRVGLYTGQHPARLGFFRHVFGPHDEAYNVWQGDTSLLLSRNWLPLETVTYAEVLKNNGYQTNFIGKWHIGHDAYGPLFQGFDQAITMEIAGGPRNYYSPYFPGNGWWNEIPDNQYLTDYLTDQAVEYIETYEKDQPFLLQFSYYNVHTPTIGRKDFHELYKERGFEGALIEYGAQVSAVDESVGRIMRALEEKGVADNTLVFFTSDQGSFFPNTPLRGTKVGGIALYEGGQKVPFLVRWPNAFMGGRTLDTHVQTSDIFPTLCEVVGDDPSKYEGLEGLSLYKLLTKDQPLNREAIIAFRSYGVQYASVLRDDNWKIVAYRDGRYELFKVDEDISENSDMSAQHPEIVQELAAILKKWEKDTGIPF